MKTNHGIDSTDQFLRLPEPLVHCILSYLPFKDLRRTSILSKRWKNLWINAWCPTLKFDGEFFGKVDSSREELSKEICAKIEYLMSVAERNLCSRHRQNVSLEELVLGVPSCTSITQACLDRCMGHALGCNVKHLNFSDNSRGGYNFSIPRTVFTSKTLTDVRLKRCKLESLSCLSLPCLKKLELSFVSADAQIIQNLIASCPAIEVLSICFCFRIEGTLNIFGLVNPKLVTAKISYCGFGRVGIEATSLESFEFQGNWYDAPPCEITVSSCKNLKKLWVGCAAITNNLLSNLSLFKELEDLKLDGCDMVKIIKISSCRLKHLSVRCANLVEVEIDAPNLSTVTYSGQNVIPFSTNALDLSSAYIILHPDNVDSLWYAKLIEFLGTFNNSISLKLQLRTEFENCLIVPEEMRKSLNPPLYNVKDLTLEVNRNFSTLAVKEIVDGLLWFSPHPVTITLKSFAHYKYWVIDFLYKEMDKDGNPCCCSSLPIKCWRHCIEKVKIKRSRGAEDEWYKSFFLNTQIFEEGLIPS